MTKTRSIQIILILIAFFCSIALVESASREQLLLIMGIAFPIALMVILRQMER